MPGPSRIPRLAPPTRAPAGGLTTFVLALAGLGAAALTLAIHPATGLPLLLPLAAARGGSAGATLENDTRRAVYERVRDHPGTSIADVASAVDVSHSTATYHLDTLSESGLVVSIEDGNKRRFFPNAGAYDEVERRCLAVLDNPATRELLATVADMDAPQRSHVAEALDVSPPTVTWHLDRLWACDFLRERTEDGRRVLSVDVDRVEDVLGGLVEKVEGTEYDAAPLASLLEALRG